MERELKGQGIMGSPYSFFFGDVKEFRRSVAQASSRPMDPNHRFVHRVLPFVAQHVQQFGDICFFWMFATPRIIIQDPELIREALTNKSSQFQKLPLQRLSRGLTALEGDKWFHHRSIVTPAFHLTKLKGMVPAFCTSCSEMIKRWQDMVCLRGVCELDVWSELNAMTADAISRTAFGSNYREGKRIFELQKQQVDLMLKPTKFPYIPVFRFVPTKDNWRRSKLSKEIDGMLRVLIHKKEKAMKCGEGEHEDLLGLMLRSNEQAQSNANDTKFKGLTVQEVMEECKLFYFAGHETTSDLLTWTMILLSMHQSWQYQAREEVHQICGRTLPNYDSISQLKIVNMILLEVLRLYPPLAAHYRRTYSKAKLGGFLLPGGVDLLLPTIIIHHDSKIWGEDAEEFNPERFSEGVLKATNSQFSYFPFGWGPRNCIGQNYAMIEAKTALAMILQHFSFELSPSYVHSPVSYITIQPQYGAPIVLHQL